MKIAIYAGTFDPIHFGHTEFASSAIQHMNLDRVVVVAEKEPYRKKPHAAWDHRQAMIERATEKIDKVDHDYHFASQLAYQHTLRSSLEAAEEHYGKEHEFWFLVGSDILEHMHQWRDLVEAADYGGFIVALRHDHSQEWLAAKQAELKQANRSIKLEAIPNQRPFTSSSIIRKQILSHQPAPLLDPAVLDYINHHHLYSSSSRM